MQPADLIFLTDFQYKGEIIPDDHVRVLFCDSQGVLTSVIIEKEIFDTAQAGVQQFFQDGKGAAAVSIEISEDEALTFPVEIDPEEASALWTIVETFLGTGNADSVPKEFVKYPEQIISRGRELLEGSV